MNIADSYNKAQTKIAKYIRKQANIFLSCYNNNNPYIKNKAKKAIKNIKKYYNKSKITLQEIKKAQYLSNKDIDFGSIVVSKISNLNEFALRWRNHFVKVMNPKYLPKLWDINKKIEDIN